MFKKKPNIKALAPLRSSDRRKAADQIIKDFHVDLPQAAAGLEDEVNQEEQGAVPASLSTLRNSLLPENVQSARFTTTAGPDLKTVSGTVYVGAHAAQEQRVLWLRMDERMYPTVYTLWHNPGLVPLLHTPSMVLRKLRGGADLMIPGLARGPPFPTAATKDSVVAVASLENPSVPCFLGVCELDVAKLNNVVGEKGRAVRGIHWEGDEIWAWSVGGKPGGSAPEHIEGWDEESSGRLNGLEDRLDQLDVKDGEDEDDGGGVALRDEPAQKQSDATTHDGFVAGEDPPLSGKVGKGNREVGVKEIDETFRKAFLYGAHHHQSTNKTNNHGLAFPLTSSFFMSNLVLPFLPIFTPAEASAFQMKKSSWKNLKKFIKYLDKQQLLKSKDRSGGETVVLDIDFEDRAIVDFVPYRLPKKEGAGAENGSGSGGNEAPSCQSGDRSIGQHLKRLGLFRPKETLAPIFESANASIKQTYLPSELRQIVITYVEGESLISPTSKRLVRIDTVLANAVFDSRSALDQEVLAKGSVPRDMLVERVQANCSPSWVILRDNGSKDDVKAKAGIAPAIQITLETRSGNKTATKVSGVEAYHINPQPLADELQKTCASSTSVGQLTGSSPKTPVMEIMVQGPQSQAVIKALEKRGINRQWIDVVDKTKGKKR